MIIGKIDYLNLLPFYVYLKRSFINQKTKQALHYKKGVPSEVNRLYQKRKIDAAFISSIESTRTNPSSLGILARGEVLSVLVKPGKTKKDTASATSNALANILGVEGEVIIGDRGLEYYLTHDDYIDLGEKWKKETGLPFVFAVLCFHKKASSIKRMEKDFLKRRIKIPQYLLQQASDKSGIKKEDILHYLKFIDYHIDAPAQKGLKRFLKEAKTKKLIPQRH